MTTIKKPPIHRIAITQLVCLLVLSGIAMLFGQTEAISILMGGVVHIAPHAWFTRMAFRYSGARQAPRVLNAMYVGETGKLLMTATLFALIFVFIQPVHLPALFAGYMAMIVVSWFGAAKALNPTKQ